MVIDEHFSFLGASPDGYCKCSTCGEFLIEIKCPYSFRNFHPKQAAKERNCYQDERKNWQLKESSSYYFQIQGQLAICKIKLCVLVIYTRKGILPINVHFNESFWQNCKKKLVDFFINHMQPKLIKDNH